MAAARGFVAGVIGLALLELTVSSKGAAGRVSGALGVVAGLLSAWLDPSRPLIPDLNPPPMPQADASGPTHTEANSYVPPRHAAAPAAPKAPIENA